MCKLERGHGYRRCVLMIMGTAIEGPRNPPDCQRFFALLAGTLILGNCNGRRNLANRCPLCIASVLDILSRLSSASVGACNGTASSAYRVEILRMRISRVKSRELHVATLDVGGYDARQQRIEDIDRLNKDVRTLCYQALNHHEHLLYP